MRQDANIELRGVGLGLRSSHFHNIENNWPDIPWFEALTDNYLDTGSIPYLHLKKINERYPIALHSVGMSLGSVDPIDWDYLKKIKTLANDIDAPLISDHLCWVSHDGRYFHDLLPLPFTEEALNHVSSRIAAIQDFLQRRILIENVSSYFTYQSSNMTEWDFLNAVCDRADCYLLLDINNIYVSSVNHHFDPDEFLNAINPSRVRQFHMAGHQTLSGYLLDSHGALVGDAVWSLYRKAVNLFKGVPTLFEWDNDIPQLEILLQERERAMKIITEELT